MSDEEDRAPAFSPFVLTVTWTVGDSIFVDYGDLEPWEAAAAFDAAARMARADDDAESNTEEEADAD